MPERRFRGLNHGNSRESGLSIQRYRAQITVISPVNYCYCEHSNLVVRLRQPFSLEAHLPNFVCIFRYISSPNALFFAVRLELPTYPRPTSPISGRREAYFSRLTRCVTAFTLMVVLSQAYKGWDCRSQVYVAVVRLTVTAVPGAEVWRRSSSHASLDI